MQWIPRKYRLALLVAAATTALTGCGGGGGGGDASDTQTASSTTIEGRAVKGTLKNAEVRIYALSGSAERGAMLWRGTTDSKGQFTADLGSYSGQYEIVVAAVAGQTRMSCDRPDGCGSVAFGEDLSVSAAFELNAMAQAGTNAGDVAVTPWTAMAAERARQLVQGGASLSEAVEAARSETSAILGFDVSAKPADLTDSDLSDEDAARYAVANAALAGILLQDGTVADNLDNLIESFRDGAFDETDPVKIGEIKRQLESVIQSPQAEIKLSDKRAELELIASSLPDDTFDPKPTEVVSGNEIEQFKAFTREVRTWLTQIEQTNFKDPLSALQIDAATVSATLNQQTADMMDELAGIARQVEDYLKSHADEIQGYVLGGQTIQLPLTRTEITGAGTGVRQIGSLNLRLGVEAGRVTVTCDAQGLDMGEGAPALNVSQLLISTPLTVEQALSAASGEVVFGPGEHVLEVEAELSTDDGLALKLTDARIALTLQKALTVDALPLPDSAPLKEAFKVASVFAQADIQDGQGNTFSGKIEARGTRLEVESVNQVNLSKITYGGTFSGSTGSFEAEVSLRLNNASTYDWQAVDQYRALSGFTQSRWVTPEDVGGIDLVEVSRLNVPTAPDEVLREIFLTRRSDGGYKYSVDVTTVADPERREAIRNCIESMAKEPYFDYWGCGGYDLHWNFYGDYSLSEDKGSTLNETFQSLTRLVINGVTYEPLGNLDYAYTSSVHDKMRMEGSVSYIGLGETENHFGNVTATLKARAALPELPEAAITIVANRSRLDGGDAAVKVDWGTGSYTALVDIRDTLTEQPSADVTFYNPNGLKLVLTSPDTEEDVIDVTGEAFVRGKKVGDLTTSEGHYVLRYSDGTFETLY